MNYKTLYYKSIKEYKQAAPSGMYVCPACKRVVLNNKVCDYDILLGNPIRCEYTLTEPVPEKYIPYVRHIIIKRQQPLEPLEMLIFIPWEFYEKIGKEESNGNS